MLSFPTLWDMPPLNSSHYLYPVRCPRNPPLPHPSGITVYPLVGSFKHFPSVLHALCTQAWWLSLPILCSFSYQGSCSVSLLILDGGTSLSDRAFILPRRKHFYFPKGTSFTLWPSSNSSSTICCRAFQGVVSNLLSQALRSGPEILTASCVISNELPKRFCCRSKFKNHCIHLPWESISINLSPPFIEVNHSPWAASRVRRCIVRAS